MNVTVIITTADSRTIYQCLQSLCSQTVAPDSYEILVIYNKGDHNVDKLIRMFQDQNPLHNIRYFHQFQPGPGAARNQGIQEANGEIIFFTTSEYIVPQNWIETLFDCYRRYPDVAGVGGWHDLGYTHGPRSWAQRCFDAMDKKFGAWILNKEVKTNLYNYNYIGLHPGNLSYRKSILEKVGGFDENLRSLRGIAYNLRIKVNLRGYCFFHIPRPVKKVQNISFNNLLREFFFRGRDVYYLHLRYPTIVRGSDRGLWCSLLELFVNAGINSFFLAYLFSTISRFCGRAFAKYRERLTVKQFSHEYRWNSFEIVKYDKTKNRTFETQGAPFTQKLDTKSKSSDFYSVVIPTYNRSHRLAAAVAHILNQTVDSHQYEIIIIDDGSSDNTRETVLEIKRQYPDGRVRYFYQKNAGPAKARNTGIKAAKGDIIFFTDDDSTVPADWMETLLTALERYPKAAGVGGWHIPPDGEIKNNTVSRYIHLVKFFSHPIVGGFIRNYEIISNDPLMFFGTFAYNTANVCYKKKILMEVEGFREDFYWPGSEDNDLAFRIALTGSSMLYIPFHVTHSKDMSLYDFTKLNFRRGANGYLLRTINREIFEELKPDFVKDYASVASFIFHFCRPEKFMAFLEWVSLNLGIIYMKSELEKKDKLTSRTSIHMIT